MSNVISSARNSRVKHVKQLQSRGKARRKATQIVLEGVRLIADALDNKAQPEFAFYTDGAEQENDPLYRVVARMEEAGALCLSATPELMREMTDTETPQGVLAVFPWPDLAIPDAPDFVFVVDGWRDPGNMGTLLRTATAAGVPLIATMPGTVDVLNPKVLRAGMGAHFRVPIHSFSNWKDLRTQFPDHTIYLADMGGELTYDAVDWTQPALIIVGEEAHGLSRAARNLPHEIVSIPMTAGTESLNAAVTASLLIYAARRHTLG